MGTAKETVAVRTPEYVRLNYVLAGLGSRAAAFFVDSVLRGLLLLCILITVLLLSTWIPILAPGDFLRGLSGTWLLALGFLAYGIVDLGYFLAFEALWSGQTPGKRHQGLRVIRTDGQPVGWIESSIRNLLRAVDMPLGAYPVGLVVMFLSRNNQRMGDYAAGTVVIVEARRGIPVQRTRGRSSEALKYPEVEACVSRLRPEQYRILRSFLDRREEMDPPHRRQIARLMLKQLLTRWEMRSRERLSEEAFLEELVAVYEQRRRAI